MWGPKFKGRRNYCLHRQWNCIRSSFLKTWSNNRLCNKLLAKTFKVEEEFLFLVWLERVPIQSNPSDELSRSEVAFWRGQQRSRVFPRELWEHVAKVRARQRLCSNISLIEKKKCRWCVSRVNMCIIRLIAVSWHCSWENIRQIRILSCATWYILFVDVSQTKRPLWVLGSASSRDEHVHSSLHLLIKLQVKRAASAARDILDSQTWYNFSTCPNHVAKVSMSQVPSSTLVALQLKSKHVTMSTFVPTQLRFSRPSECNERLARSGLAIDVPKCAPHSKPHQ